MHIVVKYVFLFPIGLSDSNLHSGNVQRFSQRIIL